MTSQALPERKSGRSVRKSGEGSEPVEQLIHQLVGLLCKQNATLEGRNGPSAEEIILDRTVDAVRYLLIRMPPATADHAPLSPREHEIVRMVADGHPTKVIAGVLNISCWTVTAHLRRIFMKLGVTSRPAMVARLLEEGRTRDVRALAEKPLLDTKVFFQASSANAAIGRGNPHGARGANGRGLPPSSQSMGEADREAESPRGAPQLVSGLILDRR